MQRAERHEEQQGDIALLAELQEGRRGVLVSPVPWLHVINPYKKSLIF